MSKRNNKEENFRWLKNISYFRGLRIKKIIPSAEFMKKDSDSSKNNFLVKQ